MPETRPLTDADADASRALGREAFGSSPARQTGAPPAFPAPGQHAVGVVDRGRLIAKAVGRDDLSWWHGSQVPTCGVAGVAVAAEHRGQGHLTTVMEALLADATTRGHQISTLFPTAPGIYRRLGYEVVTSLQTVEVPTSSLAQVAAPASGTTVHRARTADLPAVRAAYSTWAWAQNGPLTRTGACFPAAGPARDRAELDAVTGITLAEQGGQVVGYAAWRRGPGYGPDAVLHVDDLVVLTADAARALWRTLAGFASVTGTVRLRSSGDHLARLVLPSGAWQVVQEHPSMVRVHSPAALAVLSAGHHPLDLAFRVVGDPLGTLEGGWRLALREEGTTVTPIDPDGLPALSPHGLALAYAGSQPAANLRLAGHLRGGDRAFDRDLDLAFGGRRPHVLDYF